MYPVMLNIKNRVCTIIGGGEAARIKASTLIKEGAKVRIVSPALTADFSDLDILYIAKKYEKSDLNGSFIAIAATNDKKLNSYIASDAAKLGILVLDASDSKSSDFTPMAHISDGNVTVAASTGGAYPMLAKKICADVDIEAYNKICRILKEQRNVILDKDIDRKVKLKILKAIITDEMIALGKNNIAVFREAIRSITERSL